MSTLLGQFLGLDPTGDEGWQRGPVVVREEGVADQSSSLRVATVWRAVNVLAAAVATLPLKLYRRKPEGGKEEVRDHWAAQLIRLMPNRAQTSFRWRHHATGHAVLGGNYYALKMPSTREGETAALWPLDPPRMRLAEVGNDGSLTYEYTRLDGRPERYAQERIFHFRGFSTDGLVGVSVLDLMRQLVQQDLAGQHQRTSFLKNEMRPSVVITHPGDLGTDGRPKLEKAFIAAYGSPGKVGTPLVLDEGMTITSFGLNSKDSQWVESNQFRVEEFLRFIGVPGVLCGYTDKTATFASAEAFFQSFKDHNVHPWTKNFETELTLCLLGLQDELFFEFNLDAFMRADSTARAAFYRALVELGIYTRNEVRELENRNPLPGLDEPLTPLNMKRGADSQGTNGQPPAAASDEASADDDESQMLKVRTDAAGVLVRAGYIPDDAAKVVGLPSMRHLGFPPVTVQAPSSGSAPRRQPADDDTDARSRARRVARRARRERLEAIAGEAAAAVVRREVLHFMGDPSQQQKGAAVRYAGDPEGWARVVSAFYREHAALVAARLKIPIGVAQAYCTRQRTELMRDGVGVCAGWESARVPELIALALG